MRSLKIRPVLYRQIRYLWAHLSDGSVVEVDGPLGDVQKAFDDPANVEQDKSCRTQIQCQKSSAAVLASDIRGTVFETGFKT